MRPRLQMLLEMERKNPDDAFLKFSIAQEFVSMNNDDDALKYYLVVIEKYPQYVPVYYQLGHLYERRNDLAVAVGVYKKGMLVAKAANDTKTAGELKEALMLLEDE